MLYMIYIKYISCAKSFNSYIIYKGKELCFVIIMLHSSPVREKKVFPWSNGILINFIFQLFYAQTRFLVLF